MHLFQYDDALVQRFPNTVGGLILGEGVENYPTPASLQDQFVAAQRTVLEELAATSLADLPSLAAWRSTFSAFGAAPTKYRSAPEALLRRLTKKGSIPSINMLVDMGNLISIKYALPVAVFDLSSLTGGLTVRFAEGDEHYTELGSNESKHPEAGEVIFVDDARLVFARRWCWKQSLQSAAKMTTTRMLATIEAQHQDGQTLVQEAQAELLTLLNAHVSGTFSTQLLTADTPAWDV